MNPLPKRKRIALAAQALAALMVSAAPVAAKEAHSKLDQPVPPSSPVMNPEMMKQLREEKEGPLTAGSEPTIKRCENALRSLLISRKDASISIGENLSNLVLNRGINGDVVVYRADGIAELSASGGCRYARGKGLTVGAGVAHALWLLKPRSDLKDILINVHQDDITSSPAWQEGAWNLAVTECSNAFKDVFVAHGQRTPAPAEGPGQGPGRSILKAQ